MDGIVDDGFAASLGEELRLSHDILKYYGFYAGSEPQRRMELLAAARPMTVADGETLMEAGYPCRDVVLVGSGRLRVYTSGESGRQVTLYYVQRGESCPVNLGAAILGTGAFAGAEASGELQALVIPADDFRRLERDNDALRDYVISAVLLRYGEIIALIREITMRRVDQRLAAYLLRLFEQSDRKPPSAVVTQQTIAIDLGTAREVVSRRLQELEDAGAVRIRRGRIELLDRRKLSRVID